MDREKLLERIRRHPNFNRVGMIASHLGIVRGNSRDGKKVKAVDIRYDMDVLGEIVKQIKEMPGIIEVVADVRAGYLSVGDEVLFLAVGGDIREHVFPALIKGVDMIKQDAVKKREVYE
jgi:molybdopterin synthase catalytic subunit